MTAMQCHLRILQRNMAYKIIVLSKRVWRKDCLAIPKKHVQQILQKIQLLTAEPWPENIQVKQLHHYRLADFRLRIGEYRVLFDKDEMKKVIRLIRVLHRSKLY